MELIHYYEDLNTLHVGTEKPRCYYLPKKTDGTTYVDAELSDGTMCRIHIEMTGASFIIQIRRAWMKSSFLKIMKTQSM